MSNSQRPQNNSPWASGDPSWRPTNFQDAQGRDPHAPFGQQPTPPPQPHEFEPPKRPGSAVWLVVGAVVLVGAIVLGMQFLGGDASPASPSPSPSAATAQPSPERTGNFIPFEGNGDGTFEVVNYRWSGDQLTATIRVDVQEGEYSFTLFAFANASRVSYDPVDPSSFTVTAGRPYEGEVVFEMPNADSTIVLTTPSGRTALNALPIKAG